MIGFVLWREFKLCSAEVFSVFPSWKAIFQSRDLLLLDWIDREDVLKKADFLWWVIKIIEFSKEKNLIDIILNEWEIEWKLRFWVSYYWESLDLKKHIMWVKKALKEEKVSCRFVNKDFKNLSSAVIINEKLIKKWFDLNILTLWKKLLFWKTIWVQDIESYWERDFSKKRDMEIGMLPPKLAQIMLNLAWWNNIYDPFVWLWTILIEANLMWKNKLFWSDLNPDMVKASKENLRDLAEIKLLDAQKVWKSNYINEVDSIVSEWYLWEIMTKKSISLEKIKKERKHLESLYKNFFDSLKKAKYNWIILISFPFWDINWKYFYFEEIYSIVKKNCDVQELNIWNNSKTKVWSLLYKRPNQQVWREIFKLKIKPN